MLLGTKLIVKSNSIWSPRIILVLCLRSSLMYCSMFIYFLQMHKSASCLIVLRCSLGTSQIWSAHFCVSFLRLAFSVKLSRQQKCVSHMRALSQHEYYDSQVNDRFTVEFKFSSNQATFLYFKQFFCLRSQTNASLSLSIIFFDNEDVIR